MAITSHVGFIALCNEQRRISNLIWPRGLRHRSAAARLLGLQVRVPTGHECFSLVSVVCFIGRGLCDELITRPEESYRLWCFVVCDLETYKMRRLWPALGCSATGNKK